MKYFFSALSEINKKVLGKKIVLIFDFDGTLSPIAPAPDKAFFAAETKKLVKSCAGKFPTIIISGRALPDIKNKVGLRKLCYSGSHGLEGQIGSWQYSFKLSKKQKKALWRIYLEFKKLQPDFPGLLLEKKKISFVIHYRLLKPRFFRNFIKEAKKILKLAGKGGLALMRGKMALEIMPKTEQTKGSAAQRIIKKLNKGKQEKIAPIFVGDDKTDESVFSALKGGIMVRVGKSSKSRADYFLKDQKEINKFLQFILDFI